MLSPTRQQVKQLRRDNAAWPPALSHIAREAWPIDPFGGRAERIAVMRSRDFLAQLFNECGHIRLSVCRTDWDFAAGSWRQEISWDDLNRLKQEAGFGERWAVEVFPPDHEIVNVANMRHLWLLHDPPAYGWRKEFDQ